MQNYSSGYWFVYFSIYLILWPYLQHVDIPRLGIKSELQLRSVPQPWQHWILNPLHWAESQTPTSAATRAPAVSLWTRGATVDTADSFISNKVLGYSGGHHHNYDSTSCFESKRAWEKKKENTSLNDFPLNYKNARHKFILVGVGGGGVCERALETA